VSRKQFTSKRNQRPGRRVAALLVVGVVVILVVFQLVGGLESAGRVVGYHLEESRGGLRILRVLPGLPADEAGVLVGDRILELGGHRVDSSFTYDSAAESILAGSSVELRVLREGEEVLLLLTPGVPFDWWRYVLNAFAVLVHLGLVVVVLLSGPWDRRALLLVWLSAAIALELSLPLETVGLPVITATAFAVYWLLVGLEFGLELHLASSLPEPRPWLRGRGWIVVGFYLLGVSWTVINFVSTLPALSGLAVLDWVTTRAGVVFLEVLYLLWPLGVVVLLGSAALRWPKPLGRQQALLVLMGVFPWVVLTTIVSTALIFDVTPPLWVDAVEPLCLVLYPVSIFVALYRYHLFDFALVVKRSAIYTALTSALVLVFYGLLGLGGALSARLVPEGAATVWIIAGATLVLGLLFGPLRRRLEAQIEASFFPERTALRGRLGELARDLPYQGTLPEIGSALVRQLSEIFAVRWVSLLLAEGDSGNLVSVASSEDGEEEEGVGGLLLSPEDPYLEQLQSIRKGEAPMGWAKDSPAAKRLVDLGAVLSIPIIEEDKLVGILLLGAKVVDEPYPAEEVELLNLFSHHVARVLDNVRLFASATTDHLTGLPRRETVLEHLDRELERALRYERPLSVGMIDVDHFKDVNDTYGHLVGDMMLQRISARLSPVLRPTDLVGRYGGEEFLVVLPETSLEDAYQAMEKLREAMEEIRLEAEDGAIVQITVSIGVANLEEVARDGLAAKGALIAAADLRLYQAKAAGRNRVATA